MDPVKLIAVSSRKRRKSECSDITFQSNVFNVFYYLTNLKQFLGLQKLTHCFPLLQLENLYYTLATLFSISTSSVRKIVKQAQASDKENSEVVRPERQTKCKFVCDEFLIAVIRRAVQEFYSKKQYPDVSTLLAKLKTDENFPTISKSTLLKWLKVHCRMKYRRINKKPVFLERTDIRAQRETYLRNIRRYRELNYKIYYSDETWASPDQVRRKCWQILLSDEEFHALFGNTYSGLILRDMDNYTGGFLGKSAAGRIIINHIGSTDGFLAGGDDVFISKKDTKDYHGTMNFERYKSWFEKVLKLVPDKSVLVLDQAPYHRKRVPSTINPTTAWRKAQIIDWLVRNDIKMPEDVSNFNQLTKVELLQLSRENPLKPKFIVEEMAEHCGKDVKILWLPVAHCEFNPIELIWAAVKGYVAKHNTGKNITEMYSLVLEALNTITPEIWKRCVAHAVKYEEKMWKRDRLIDEDLFGEGEDVVIHIEDGGDTTSESESDDELLSDTEPQF